MSRAFGRVVTFAGILRCVGGQPILQTTHMSGIDFLVDERGNKKAAVIDLRRHRFIWEDFSDALIVQMRAGEPRESLEEVKRRLRLKRRNG